MTYASDARLLIDVGGIPTVVFGPGDVWAAHGPNESGSAADRVFRHIPHPVFIVK